MLFSSFWNYMRGYVKVELTGVATERFLTLCRKRQIALWNLTPEACGYSFCVAKADFFLFAPLVRKTRTRVRVVKRCGVPFLAHRYRKRKIFLCGLILFGVVLYELSGFLWHIEIHGNSYLSEEVILDFLSEENASFGQRLGAIDCESLEETFRNAYPEVIWVSIQLYGTKMTVELQENLLLPAANEPLPDVLYTDLVASCDGVITDIITRAGTPLVKAGDEVSAGQILVSGCISILDDEEQLKETMYVRADADITAEMILPYVDYISGEIVQDVRTGQEKTTRSLTFLEQELFDPFFQTSYELYEVYADTVQARLSSNFYLPVFYTKKTYYELQRTSHIATADEIRAIAAKNLGKHLADLEEKGVQITEKHVMIEKMDSDYIAQGSITVRGTIAIEANGKTEGTDDILDDTQARGA